MSTADEKLVLRNVEIMYRNFNGQPSQYHPEGRRTFCVLLPIDLAEKLKADGWNIRYIEGRVEGAEVKPYMEVTASYGKGQPPAIMLVTKRNKTQLSESDVGMLDFAEITYIDMVINPYPWEVNNNSGVKAYLKSMYVTIEEDELAEEYASVGVDDTKEIAEGVR